MVLIGRASGIFESEQYQQGSKNIGGRFNGVCNESIRVSKNTCDTFYNSKDSVTQNAEVGSFYCLLFFCVLHRIETPFRFRATKEAFIYRIKNGKSCIFRKTNILFMYLYKVKSLRFGIRIPLLLQESTQAILNVELASPANSLITDLRLLGIKIEVYSDSSMVW